MPDYVALMEGGGVYEDLTSILILCLADILDSEPDIRTFMNEVGSRSTKWEGVACELGLEDLINQIKEDVQGAQARFRRVFQEWSKRKQKRTWSMIIKALNAPQVEECKLAYDLKCILLDS